LGEAIRSVTTSTSTTPPPATSPYLAHPLPKVEETDGVALVLEHPDLLDGAIVALLCTGYGGRAQGAKSGLITPVG
jgi:hypothetical protein